MVVLDYMLNLIHNLRFDRNYKNSDHSFKKILIILTHLSYHISFLKMSLAK